MRTLWLVVLAGCWSSSSKPATAPAPAESSASAAGGGAYGGAQYATLVGSFASLEGSLDDSAFASGTGSGGGGTGSGIGTIGTSSGGYGTSGSGYGVGGGMSGGNGPHVHIGVPSTQGDLDKAIIRRYVKRNAQKFQYCYEKELLATPGIKGQVVVDFEISVDGTVARSTGTGLKNVADCMALVVERIQFPKLKGGSPVQVSYPLLCEPTPTP